MPESRSLLIDGKPALGGAEPLRVLNPTTGEVIAVVECADATDIDRAVEVGARRFEEGVWSKRGIHERARILNKFADLIEGALEDLYQLETLNNGRPIRETRAQIARLPEWYRYNAALLLADRASVVPMPGPYHSYTERSPLGVVGILSSFNHPLMITSKSLAPALATGSLEVASWGYILTDGQLRMQGSAEELRAIPDLGKLFLGRGNAHELATERAGK